MRNIIIYGRDGTNGANGVNGVNGVNGRDGWRTRGRGETATHTIGAEGTGTGQAVGAETDGREGDEGAGMADINARPPNEREGSSCRD